MTGHCGQDPQFTTLARTPLTWAFIIDKLKILLSRLGYDSALYSGHSFRIGAATTAAAANIPDHMIRTLGRCQANRLCVGRWDKHKGHITWFL